MTLPGQQEQDSKVRVKAGEQDFQYVLITRVQALKPGEIPEFLSKGRRQKPLLLCLCDLLERLK